MRRRGVCLLVLAGACAGPALPSQSEPAVKADEVRGIIRAVDQAMISTDLAARASKINFQEGDRFRKGDVIVEFDCRKQRADLAAAEAQLLEMTLTLDKYRLLVKAQAAGKNEIEIAEARAAKATAEAEGLKSRLDQCVLVAPFDGRVLELTLHVHESPQPGHPFIGLVSDGGLEIDLIVPSAWASWLKTGDPFGFLVDETKSNHEVTVKRIGAAVDAVSQTIKIVASIKNSNGNVLPGMSGAALLQREGG